MPKHRDVLKERAGSGWEEGIGSRHRADPGEGDLVWSARPPDASSRLAALIVVLVSALVFAILAPLAKTPLAAHPNFMPLNQTVLVVNDLITALLLLLQLRVTRSAALLALACGYLYTSLMAAVHLLTFPGVFAPTGLLGAGAQTTGYLFVFWHVGLPLAAIGYVALDRKGLRLAPSAQLRTVPIAVAATLLLIAGLTVLTTAAGHWFPPMLDGNRYSSEFNAGRYGQWLLAACAIVVLWRRGLRSVLELWLAVALFSWFIEIALVGIFNAGRYDLGFYAGRVYGLLSSVFVLCVLLFEQAGMYAGVLASRERERVEAEVRASRDVLRLAMQAGGMGAWSIDLAGGGIWISTELEALLGDAPSQAPREPRRLLRRVHRDDAPRLRRTLAEAVSHGDDFAVEIRVCHRRGEWRWMDVRGRVVAGEAGGQSRLVGVGMDVTAQRDAESALREADRHKDEFLATLAHELRNPLAPIRHSVQAMARMEALPRELERIRGVLDRQSQQLGRLVDDLLDVSRIKQGKVHLRKGRVSLRDVLQDALDATRPVMETARHQAVLSAGDDPLWLDADPTRLVQVFVNLLNNAAKFTPAGGRIVVAVECEGALACVRIRDNGIGVAPDQLEAIFGIFNQAQGTAERSQGGLGIGLALVRGFVALHGGTVQAWSAGIGHGTEFVVSLPLQAPGVPDRPARGCAPGAPWPMLGASALLPQAESAGR